MKNLDLFPDGAWAAPGESSDSVPAVSVFASSDVCDAVTRAVKARVDYGHVQMERTFPSLFSNGLWRWERHAPGEREQYLRHEFLAVFVYLSVRVSNVPELRAELEAVRAAMGDGWDSVLEEVFPEEHARKASA